MKKLLTFIFATFITTGASAMDRENTIYMDLTHGRVVIELLPDAAPMHVAQIKRLAREGFYDNIAFHRVIPGFMAQAGCPQGRGTGGSGTRIGAGHELNNIPHTRGILSMAHAGDANAGDSQFFIMFGDAPWLDGVHVVWGRVVSGMEFIDMIRSGSHANNGMVDSPDRIIRMRVAADVQ
ncbi:MAG: peptidylprolyl isomerase [Alphaproteobacteria bacterium]|nr:peptidylprolyl isomerase [Alphaproteobacteria bacterium]